MDTKWTDARTPKQKYQARLTALKTERQSWDAHWRELAEVIQPRSSRFLSAEKTVAGQKKNDKIVNGTPTWAARVLASGMMAGITSPARAWFRLTTPDPELAEYGAVKEWLHTVEERIRQALSKSNVYNGLHQVYQSLGTFGIAAMHIEDDVEDVLRAYVYPVGQFYLANSARLRVDTTFRETSMTVAQLVEMFDADHCSPRVQNAFERGAYDESIDIVHLIEPNRGMKPGLAGHQGMRWKSCWFEANAGEAEKYTFLRESGYEEFPDLCPRWSVCGEDVYGSSPGMEALGDARALQLLERRKLQALDKIVTPPMTGPTSLMNRRMSLLPGDYTAVDAPTQGMGFRPAIEVNPAAMSEAREAIREHEARIKTAFYADLWLMMSQDSQPEMTAREVAERHEEKMLQLGPVMERLEDELLEPLIERTFGILLRNGDIPPPPEEMQGGEMRGEMRIEYLSIMAQAQKLLGIGGIERLAGFVGNLAAAKPDVLDKIDFDQMIDEMGNMLGVPPALVRTDEAVAEIRAQKAQAAQQQMQMEQMQQAAQGAQTLSQTDMESDNALTRLMGNLGPTAAAGAGTGTLQ